MLDRLNAVAPDPILGIIAGFVNLFRITLSTAREEEAIAREKEDADGGAGRHDHIDSVGIAIEGLEVVPQEELPFV